MAVTLKAMANILLNTFVSLCSQKPGQALRSRAALGWWLGLAVHMVATSTICSLPSPRAVPAGLRTLGREIVASCLVAGIYLYIIVHCSTL